MDAKCEAALYRVANVGSKLFCVRARAYACMGVAPGGPRVGATAWLLR